MCEVVVGVLGTYIGHIVFSHARSALTAAMCSYSCPLQGDHDVKACIVL